MGYMYVGHGPVATSIWPARKNLLEVYWPVASHLPTVADVASGGLFLVEIALASEASGALAPMHKNYEKYSTCTKNYEK